jgi:hypothetical protein
VDRPEFDITITRSGKVKVRVKGVRGTRCTELADLIREIVGREEHRELTSDYYAEGKVRIQAQVRDTRAG